MPFSVEDQATTMIMSLTLLPPDRDMRVIKLELLTSCSLQMGTLLCATAHFLSPQSIRENVCLNPTSNSPTSKAISGLTVAQMSAL
eukprot:4662452-Ditylum_brightwellii.AAC.1